MTVTFELWGWGAGIRVQELAALLGSPGADQAPPRGLHEIFRGKVKTAHDARDIVRDQVAVVWTELDTHARYRKEFLSRGGIPGLGTSVQGCRRQGQAIRAERNAPEAAGMPGQGKHLSPVLRIPQYGGIITPANQQLLSIRAVNNGIKRFTFQLEDHLPAADLPDAGAAAPAGGCQPGAVRAEVQAADRAGLAAESLDGLSRRDVPQHGAAIVAAGGEMFPIRAEFYGPHNVGMAAAGIGIANGKSLLELTALQIPGLCAELSGIEIDRRCGKLLQIRTGNKPGYPGAMIQFQGTRGLDTGGGHLPKSDAHFIHVR